MGNKAKKLIALTASLMFLLTALAACKTPDNSGSNNSSGGGDSSGGGQQGNAVFALENDHVELETEEDLELLVPFNDYGTGEPTVSLDTSVKKFGEASIKVENKANSKFNSDNSWPSVEVPFSKPQDFSTKKYTQFHVYSAESEPFVMDIQFSVDGFTGFKSNVRQINPGWNVIEIANDKSRDFNAPVDFSKITSFIFSTYGHATKDCVYYIDDIVLTDQTGMTGDVYNLVSLEYTSYAETKGSNLMLPYTMFQDSLAGMPTELELTEDGKLLLTQYIDWHCLMFNAFNVGLSEYSVLSVDFENVEDKEIEVAIAAEGGDYRDGGPRIAPSAAMVRKKLQPGEKATLNLEISAISKALRNKSTSLTLDNLAFFHIYSIGKWGEYRTFAITSMKVLTEDGIVIDSAAKVDDKLAKLPAAEELKMKHISVVSDIRAQYDALSEEGKALIKNYDILVAAEAAIAAFDDADYADGVEELIAGLPAVVDLTLEDIEAIASVRATYDALTDDAKALVENYSLLTEAESKMDELTADVVEALISALPALEDITLEDGPAIVAARDAYDALTQAQKDYVENYAVLEAAENKIQASVGSGAVEALISKLKQSGKLTGDDVRKIIAAREAYNALTKEEKAEVSNFAALESAEANMLVIFNFTADNTADFQAGLYGGYSADQLETGYTTDTIGGVEGAGWFNTKFKEGNYVVGDDLNGDGYANDNAYIGVKYKAAHEKSAYQALLDAGYETITFSFYQVADAGSIAFWSRFADEAFFWHGNKDCNTWITIELSLEQFIAYYDDIAGDKYLIIGGDVNTQTALTTVYLTDITVKALPVEENKVSQSVIDAINALKQEGAFNGADVNAVLAAREAYNALSEEGKAKITNVELLENAEKTMLMIFNFTADNTADFQAGLYGGYSADQLETGYTTETIGGVAGAGWFSTKFQEGNYVVGDDLNGDGYANDNAYIGVKYKAAHEKSAYQALLDAGYETITFSFYQVADAGSIAFWSKFADEAFFWHGNKDCNTWITIELSLEQFIAYYDDIAGDKYLIIGGDVNTQTALTTVYLTDITVKA